MSIKLPLELLMSVLAKHKMFLSELPGITDFHEHSADARNKNDARLFRFKPFGDLQLFSLELNGYYQ